MDTAMGKVSQSVGLFEGCRSGCSSFHVGDLVDFPLPFHALSVDRFHAAPALASNAAPPSLRAINTNSV